MRSAASLAAALGLTMLVSAGAQSATIKLATWNMNNLHHVLGEPLRSGAPVRTEADYAILQQYRDRLGADVIALQEVLGPNAAALVFPPEQYDLFFSARYIDDLVTARLPIPILSSARIASIRALASGVVCSMPSASATSRALA